MAKGDLVLDIGSKFNDEGFKKLNAGIKNVGKQTQSATRGINQVVGALGGVEGKAGKIFGSLSNIMGSFAHGGVMGLAIAGVGTAFKFVSEKMAEAKERAKRFADELKDNVLKAVEKIKDSADVLTEKFSRSIQLMKQLAGVKDSEDDTVYQARINNIKQNAREERKGLTKDYDIQYSKAKEAREIAVANAENSLDKKVKTESLVTQTKNAKQNEIKDLSEQLVKAQEKAKHVTGRQQIADEYNATVKRINSSGLNATVKNMQLTGAYEQYQKKLKDYDDEDNQKTRDEDKARLEKANAAVDAIRKKKEAAESALVDLINEETKAHNQTVLEQLKYNDSVASADEQLREAGKAKEKAIAQEKEAADKKKADEDKALKAKQKTDAKEAAKKDNTAKKNNVQDEIERLQEGFAKNQKELNDKLADAKKAVSDWVQNLRSNSGQSFSDFNKAQNDKDKLVVLGKDANGEDITISKKQANQVKSNRQILERLKNNKHLNASQQRELERRQAFDDQFNPEKLKEKRDEEARLKKQLENAEKQQKDDIHKLRKMLVDDNGVAV